MSETKPAPRLETRLLQVLLIVAGLVILLVFAIVSLSIVGVYQRVLPPPAFAIHIGPNELIAPCPRGIFCDESTAFYAIWWGEPRPNGKIRYKQLFFVYLKPNRPRPNAP